MNFDEIKVLMYPLMVESSLIPSGNHLVTATIGEDTLRTTIPYDIDRDTLLTIKKSIYYGLERIVIKRFLSTAEDCNGWSLISSVLVDSGKPVIVLHPEDLNNKLKEFE